MGGFVNTRIVLVFILASILLPITLAVTLQATPSNHLTNISTNVSYNLNITNPTASDYNYTLHVNVTQGTPQLSLNNTYTRNDYNLSINNITLLAGQSIQLQLNASSATQQNATFTVTIYNQTDKNFSETITLALNTTNPPSNTQPTLTMTSDVNSITINTSTTINNQTSYLLNLSIPSGAPTTNFTINISINTTNGQLTLDKPYTYESENYSLSANITITGNTPLLLRLNTSASEEGNYTITIFAYEKENASNNQTIQLNLTAINQTSLNQASASNITIASDEPSKTINTSQSTKFTINITNNNGTDNTKFNLALNSPNNTLNYAFEETSTTNINLTLDADATRQLNITINASTIGNYQLEVFTYEETNTSNNDTLTITINVIDEILPVINNATINDTLINNGTTILITVNATDNLAIANVTADNYNLTKNDNIYTTTLTMNATDGDYNITIIVTDTSGNQQMTNINYTLDSTAPNITSINVTPSVINASGVATFTLLLAGEDNTSIATVTVEGAAMSWNGSAWTGTGQPTQDGIINVLVADHAGNTATTNTTITIDSTKPNITLIINHTTINDALQNNTLLFGIQAKDNHNLSTLRYRIDKGVWQTLTQRINQTHYSNVSINHTLITTGKHELSIEATDYAENIETVTRTFYNNQPINLTRWMITLNTSLGLTNANITYANGTPIGNDNITINDTFTISMQTTTNITINLENVQGGQQNWGNGTNDISISTTNTTINETLNQAGTSAQQLINVNTEKFGTNYTGRTTFPLAYNQTDGFYHCDEEGCTKITQQCPLGNADACYDNTTLQNKTIINVKHFSSIVATKDDSKPTINISWPTNTTTNHSYMTFSWSINEEASCNININGTTPSVTGDYTEYQASYQATSNDLYTYNITCTDLAGNTNMTLQNITLNDTTNATISYSENPDTDNFRISWSADEDVQVTLYVTGEDGDGPNPSYARSGLLRSNDLKDDETYNYRLYICDRFNNCHNITDTITTDKEETTSTSTSSSSSTSTTTSPFNYEKTQTENLEITYISKTWAAVEKGQVLYLETNFEKSALRDVSVQTAKKLDKATLGVYAHESIQEEREEALLADPYLRVYAYTEVIGKSNLDKEALTSEGILSTYTIPWEWFEEEDLFEEDLQLYLYKENYWQPQKIVEIIRENNTLLVTAQANDFGLYALTAKGSIPRQGTNTKETFLEGEVAIQEENNTRTNQTNEEPTNEEPIEEEQKPMSKELLLLIIIIATTLLLGAGVAIYFYLKHVKHLREEN